MLEALPRVTDPPVGVDAGVNPEDDWDALRELVTLRPTLMHLRQYRQDIETLCHYWGLRCPWAAPWVHTASLRWANAGMSIQDFLEIEDQVSPQTRSTIRNLVSEDQPPLRRLPWLNSSLRKLLAGNTDRIVPISLVPPYFTETGTIAAAEGSSRYKYLLDKASVRRPSKVHVEVEFDPISDDLTSAKERAVRELERRWEQTRRALEAEGFDLENTKPALSLHVHWLFLRICPQNGRPLGWSIIARREHKTVDTVRVPVRLLAKELEISLPPLPPGPRPKFRE